MKKRDVVGRKIKFSRIEKGLTQTQLAKRLDVSVNYISLIENGKRYPSMSLLNKISNQLSIPINSLIKDDQLEEDLREIARKYSCDLRSLREKLLDMQ